MQRSKIQSPQIFCKSEKNEGIHELPDMSTILHKHIVIVAGEESGDQHAATLVKQLTSRDNSIQISGIGGKNMQAAGVNLLFDLAYFGVTGITEVGKHIYIIYKAFKLIKKHLQTVNPDLLILVDYPGFNLRLAKFAKQKLGIRILYYISPQIWAWKAKRIKLIRNNIDNMAVILPFEKEIYQQNAVPVSFVGHPLINKIALPKANSQLRTEFELPLNKRIVAMLPGSRNNEIAHHLPVLVATAIKLHAQLSDLHFVIPIAGNLNAAKVQAYFNNVDIPITFINGHALEIMSCSDCVVVASGTATLECALLAKPMCIIYKSSLLTFIAAAKLIKIKYLGLCNLLFDKMIVPELLQYDCNATELTKTLILLLTATPVKEQMTKALHQLRHKLSNIEADCLLPELVKKLL